MLRHSCLLMLILCAAQVSQAANVPIPREEGFVPRTNEDRNDIFEHINNQLRGIDKNGPGKADGMYVDSVVGGRGVVDRRNAFLCPICREPYFKHDVEGFQCVPKDENGDPIKVAMIEYREGHCPICKVTFKGAVPCNINDKAGLDRDYCAHSLGKVTIHSNVWVCPGCAYASLIERFDRTWKDEAIPQSVSDLVLKKLKPEMHDRLMKQIGMKAELVSHKRLQGVDKFEEYIKQEELKDWLKYESAIAIYKEEKAPHVLMARLYLEAAHACRREMNSEIFVPFLHLNYMESLSRSIRLMQNNLTSGALNYRRDHKLGDVFDPTRPETDPAILIEAAKMIIDFNDRFVPSEPNANGAIKVANNALTAGKKFTGFSRGDMFVLYIRMAGFYDRLGKMDDASAALQKALDYLPADARMNADVQIEEEVAAYVNKQLDRIKDFVDSRKKCLAKEREYLGRAMWENLAALHQNEIQLNVPKSWLNSTEKDGVDPAMTAYMLGELARRTGEPGTAPLWFQAAKKIVEKQSQQVEDEEKAIGTALAQVVYKKQRDRSDELRRRWQTASDWSTEQLALTKIGGAMDANIKIVFDKMLQECGIAPFQAIDSEALADTHKMVDPKGSAPLNLQASDPKLNAKPAQPEPIAPPAASEIKTRDELYRVYYEAIAKYVKKKGDNPPDLSTLVKERFLSQGNSCLDGKGQLICPETRETLNYARSFEIGSKNDFILFSAKNTTTSKVLFADGTVKVPGQIK